MRILPHIAAVIAIGASSVAMAAKTIPVHIMPDYVAIIPGQCDSLTDGDGAGCSFTGNINTSMLGNNSYLQAQSAYNAAFDPNIALNPLFSVESSQFLVGGSQFIANGNGSFTFNLADNIDLDFFAIKGSNEFTLYEYIGGLDNSLTFTRENLSHVVFFGNVAPPVPEPGTWAMMLLGFGAIGFVLRRRKPGAAGQGPMAESLPQVINSGKRPCLGRRIC